MEQDRVACLMVSCDLFILFGNNLAPFFSSDPHLYKSPVNIILTDKTAVFSCRKDCCLIHQVFQIRACKAGGRLSYPVQIHVLSQGLFLGMNL